MDLKNLNDDDIVISGIGCKLPQMDNIPQVIEKLLEGSDFITKNSEKFERVLNDLPGYEGKIEGVTHFDNTFFGISTAVCQSMDPYSRLILERAFEAVIDAGLNPAELKQSNACCISSTSFSPYDLNWQAEYIGGYGIMGKNRSMNANRVSYWLDLKGSSFAADGNYANGIMNLANGWEEIRQGRSDIAIVSTANLNKNDILEQLNYFKPFSPDGKNRSYDDSANGWCPGEAVVVFVLQKAKYAKRCYAIVEYALSKCYGSDIIHIPSQKCWEKLLNEFYTLSKINVNDVYYVEGQGAGIKEEDAEELKALNTVFCKNRENPLLVGSIKSNIGDTQSSGGACGIIKATVSLDKCIIPKNVHYDKMNSLAEGNIKIVDENTKMPSTALVAVNALGIGGNYAHVALRGNPKIRRKEYDGVPRLVLLSARTDAFMDEIIDEIESAPIDVEQIALLQDLNSKRMGKYLARGYTILPKVGETSIREHASYEQEKRPVWFIFSGMGSQWPKMGKRLMDLPLFRESIEKSHKILLEKGLDLINIITTDDSKIFDNILHSFVGIAAIQIALVDILNAVNIVPDNMIGHSVGELGCSYADGCLTAEQTILCAYSRGKASIETELIKGFMAAVGKGYYEIKDELPDGIEVACHNASNSCTISGPAELVKNYVEELTKRKIFARTVNVANIAYHSQYIKPAAPKLLKYLQEVIPEPKLRSSKWISTSNLEENWDTDLAKYCSAEYHTNNLLSSVYFEEGSKHIPKNAICIEIAPHGLLQAILKRSLEENVINIPLTNRLSEDSLNFFLQAIGKLYINGLEPQVLNLYPKVEYPVSRGTASIHHLIRWQHEVEHPFAELIPEKKCIHSLKQHLMKFSDDAIGYNINDSNYYPLGVLLHLVWFIFASSQKKSIEECPVSFENVRIEKPATISDFGIDDDAYIFRALATGNFEVITDHLVVEGYVKLWEEDEEELENVELVSKSASMNKNDIYKEFARRGCVVGNDFQVLDGVEVADDVWAGKIPLNSDIIRVIESIIQLEILKKGEKCPSLSFPISIKRLIINPKLHLKYKELNNSADMQVVFQSTTDVAKCGGVEANGLKLQELTKSNLNLKFESIMFEPFMEANHRDFWRFVDFCLNIICDNLGDVDINIIQITNGIRLPSIISYLQKNFAHLKLNALMSTDEGKQNISHNDLVICDEQSLSKAARMTGDLGFIFVKSSKSSHCILPEKMSVITKYLSNEEEYILLKKDNVFYQSLISDGKIDFVTMPTNNSMVPNVLKEIENSKKVTYLVAYKEISEDCENYGRLFSKEYNAQIRWILILDETAPKFSPTDPFYANQLQKGLVTNIYKNGRWGFYYKKEFREDNIPETFWPKSNNGVIPNYIGIDLLEDSNVVEYSGLLKDKTKVIGVGTVRKNELIPDPHLKWTLPPSWNLDDASTIPLSYALAYYCLNIVAKFHGNKLERVLVTDGLSSNGQAAIAVAIHIGARVFVTVNDKSEITAIKKLFPSVNESDILIHDENDYDVQLGLRTNGLGCDVILNTLENEKLLSSMNCLPTFTQRSFLFHFRKEDLKKNAKIGMLIFLQNASFSSMYPEVLLNLPLNEKNEIRDFITQGIKEGFIKPLPKVVTSQKDLKKVNEEDKKSKKILISSDSNENQKNRLKIDSQSSYVIIGDESESWMDVLQWLLRRNVNNIVINVKNVNVQEAHSRIEAIKRSKNVILSDGEDIVGLLSDAKKLGPLAAVFVMRMFQSNGLKLLTELDKEYRDPNGHLIIISKHEDPTAEICKARTANNYISTNFIWFNNEILTDKALNFIEKIFGEEPIIHVYNIKKNDSSDHETKKFLAEILPKSIEEFCELRNPNQEVKLTEMPTLAGKNLTATEVSPLIVIPGLQCNPEKFLLPLAKIFMYRLFYAQGSDQYSVRDLAAALLPSVLSVNKNSNAYNILGISHGCYVAIELSKLIEESGGNVSLLLINGPLRSLKESLVAKNSLEEDLLNIVKEISTKDTASIDPKNSFTTSVDQIVKLSEIEVEKQNEFKQSVNFVYKNLQAMIDYDYSNIKLKGPLTIMLTNKKLNDSIVKRICNNTVGYHFDVENDELFSCKKLTDVIHGSLINSSMAESTIHYCSWKELEEFLEDTKRRLENCKESELIQFKDTAQSKLLTLEV